MRAAPVRQAKRNARKRRRKKNIRKGRRRRKRRRNESTRLQSQVRVQTQSDSWCRFSSSPAGRRTELPWERQTGLGGTPGTAAESHPLVPRDHRRAGGLPGVAANSNCVLSLVVTCVCDCFNRPPAGEVMETQETPQGVASFCPPWCGSSVPMNSGLPLSVVRDNKSSWFIF